MSIATDRNECRPLAGVARRLAIATGIALSALSASLQSPPAAAYGGLSDYQLSAEEVGLLPEFCKHTQLIARRHGNATDQQQWIERVGPSFLHMHHYCIAVVAYVRSFRHANTAADRNGYLVFAWQNLDYVVRNATPGFVLLPEVLYRRGQVRLRQGNAAEAKLDFEAALAADPSHVRASYELSQVAAALGDRAQARAILEEALQRSPDSRLLKTALADLDGARKK